ncbi:linear amide C-N hydrolase [Zobellella denitrificans]|nr:linear amide C-N hydrolase [Zobellella denitrificans]
MKKLAALILAGCAVLGAGLTAPQAQACTRAVYLGEEGRILTGRTMDWKTDIGTHLWVLPRGVERHGAAGPASLRWTVKYGSVIASAYDLASSDGLNEAGLAANLLWLPDSVFPEPDGTTPTLSLSLWAQYMLDNFATVAEAVEHVRKHPFLVLTGQVPGQDRDALVHLSLSDAGGDSAIMEYLDGELVIHHGRDYQVLTNEPPYAQQLALLQYWENIGGTTMLPGTNRPADRFARAHFYINAVPRVEDARLATAAVFSVIRNVSVPYGVSTPEVPHISSTRWRSVVDHKDLRYYFESALSPSTFWLDLQGLDFAPEAGSRVLRLGEDQRRILAGEVSAELEASEPLTFQPAAVEAGLTP